MKGDVLRPCITRRKPMTTWTIRRLLMLTLVALVATLGACAPADEYDEAEDATATETDQYGAEEGIEDGETEGYGTDETGTEVAAAGEVEWGTWDEWDADADAELTREEFDAGFEAAWDWDVDGDGVAGPDEVSDNFWDLFDGNDDDLIDETEYADGQERFEAGAELGAFADADTDGDGHLGRTEYDEWLNESAWDGVWDTDDDGVVGGDELADTFWDWFDLNDDNLIDESEFEQVTA
jgi:hypothetical protein